MLKVPLGTNSALLRIHSHTVWRKDNSLLHLAALSCILTDVPRFTTSKAISPGDNMIVEERPQDYQPAKSSRKSDPL